MDVLAALRAGRPVLLPVDTVYGLCATPDEVAARRVYELKGRAARQPTALLAASDDALRELVPELPDDLDALLPGPYTLVLPNPRRRYRWLAGETPEKIGVRVPQLPPATAAAVGAVGAVLATSANDPGGPNPVALDDVPARIRAGCGAELDLGRLPGTPSTVVDLTGKEPVVLREGAVSTAEALSRIAAWRSRREPSSS
jgi:tRNA threonylcarbamoyl adenosine modification protein (Sua5/YciO/YrdC/YwlC family)